NAEGSPSRPEETLFDPVMLQSRGIDRTVADSFRHGPRFLPGENALMLNVNGRGRGRITARFNEQGQLCADAAFQKQAGLETPPGFTGREPCFDLRSAWPQTELHLDPAERRADLV
ncbi:FimD/PapC N-terminal domain-containing protein, partial [Serratia quinivorans]